MRFLFTIIWTGNMTNLQGSYMTMTGKTCSRLSSSTKTGHNILNAHLRSIGDIDNVFEQTTKGIKTPTRHN